MVFQSARPLVLAGVIGLALSTAAAQEVRIPLPKRSKPTPVQKLNRDGVAAVKKNKLEEAKKLFYKAYLLDPNDPFTLNNLGYVAELEGDIERATRYYELSQANHSEAVVDRASVKDHEGKTVSAIAGRAEAGSMMVNRLNIEAIGLLNKDRVAEADAVLQKALAMDTRNPFTLNNLGHAKEKQGEYEQALSFYTQAARTNSDEKIIVAVKSDWRGKKISDIASQNAEKMRDLLDESQDVEQQVARLNLRGVSAINRNDRRTAKTFFQQAYRLDPENAFTLNNMGYLAELEGDRETANFYYAKAQEAERADAKVAVATRRDAEGKPLERVATQNDLAVAAKMQAEVEAKRRQGGDVQLKRRDGTVVVDPPKPPETNQPQ